MVCLYAALRGRYAVYRHYRQCGAPSGRHRAGKGAKYTRGRGPLELVYQEKTLDKSAALRREYQIKRLTRQEKEQLIQKAWK